ncbi:MAG: CHAT domain-containing protein [Nitrospirae bacterium]|nr:CHAT domain-containing protein [Nitrospirota bacterium]
MLPLQNAETKDKFSLTAGNKLYNLLLAEALKEINTHLTPLDRGENKNIIIVPDGILGMLPFETLVISNPPSPPFSKGGMGGFSDIKDTVFVGDRWKINYYQSATVMALNRTLKPSGAKKAVFALGDPIFDKKDPRYIAYLKKEKPVLLAQNLSQYSLRQRGIKIVGIGGEDDRDIAFCPLPETHQEVLTIAKLFNTAPQAPDVLLDVDANETRVKKTTLSAYRYLHFATHGFLSSNLQGIKEPVLVLSQVENKEGDDGMLALTEVLGLKLDTDMVVLSACVTGAGKVMEGEGVANFARAFQYAGARSVVVSLWEVASKETVEYMESLYRYLKAGKGRGEALRLARKEIKAKYPNPFYWAPFILHGEG